MYTYLPIDGDFEQLVVPERLGAKHQAVIVLGRVARGGAVVVAEDDTAATSSMKHVEPQRRTHTVSLVLCAVRAVRADPPHSIDTTRRRRRIARPSSSVRAQDSRCDFYCSFVCFFQVALFALFRAKIATRVWMLQISADVANLSDFFFFFFNISESHVDFMY